MRLVAPGASTPRFSIVNSYDEFGADPASWGARPAAVPFQRSSTLRSDGNRGSSSLEFALVAKALFTPFSYDSRRVLLKMVAAPLGAFSIEPFLSSQDCGFKT